MKKEILYGFKLNGRYYASNQKRSWEYVFTDDIAEAFTLTSMKTLLKKHELNVVLKKARDTNDNVEIFTVERKISFKTLGAKSITSSSLLDFKI